jgi:hypothetical protein
MADINKNPKTEKSMTQQSLQEFLAAARHYLFALTPAEATLATIPVCK